MSYYLHISFLAVIFLLILLSKKYSFFLDNKIEKHKKIVGKDKNYFLGGVIIMIFLFYYLFINKELIKFFFFLNIFLIGLVSDLKVLNDPKKRFFLQLIIILFFVFILDIKVPATRWTQLDILLENNIYNYFFVTFCLMILVNGSNFVDGINTLLTSYFAIIFAFIVLTKTYNLIDQNLVFNFLLLLLLLIILNSFGIIILGDSGSYLLSVFAGIYLIKISNNFTVSPYYIILLLWYPSFELLFSIIRRYLKKNSSYEPDTLHLHQILYKSIKKFTKLNNIKINHLLTSLFINFYNFISFYIGIRFISETQSLVLIIFVNVSFYIFLYRHLNKSIRTT